MLLNFIKAIINKVISWLGFRGTASISNPPRTLLNVKLQELITRQQDSYRNVFCAPTLQSQFHQPTHHYDWWMFPMSVPESANVSETTRRFSITDQETVFLLNHHQFISTYLHAGEKYLGNLEIFGWNNYDIRYAKMLQSLNQFTKIAQQQSDPALASVYQQLCRLSQRAIDFANANISARSTLFSQGMINLQQALQASKTYTPARDCVPTTCVNNPYGTRTKQTYCKINRV